MFSRFGCWCCQMVSFGSTDLIWLVRPQTCYCRSLFNRQYDVSLLWYQVHLGILNSFSRRSLMLKLWSCRSVFQLVLYCLFFFLDWPILLPWPDCLMALSRRFIIFPDPYACLYFVCLPFPTTYCLFFLAGIIHLDRLWCSKI